MSMPIHPVASISSAAVLLAGCAVTAGCAQFVSLRLLLRPICWTTVTRRSAAGRHGPQRAAFSGIDVYSGQVYKLEHLPRTSQPPQQTLSATRCHSFFSGHFHRPGVDSCFFTNNNIILPLLHTIQWCNCVFWLPSLRTPSCWHPRSP